MIFNWVFGLILLTLMGIPYWFSYFKRVQEHERLTQFLKYWGVGYLWYLTMFIGDNSFFSVRRPYSMDYDLFHYSNYFLVIELAIIAGYIVGKRKTLLNLDVLVDIFALITICAMFACWHDQSPTWHFIKDAILGNNDNIEWFINNWTNPAYQWPIAGDWWLFGIRIPFGEFTSLMYFAFQWMMVGILIGITSLVIFIRKHARKHKILEIDIQKTNKSNEMNESE